VTWLPSEITWSSCDDHTTTHHLVGRPLSQWTWTRKHVPVEQLRSISIYKIEIDWKERNWTLSPGPLAKWPATRWCVVVWSSHDDHVISEGSHVTKAVGVCSDWGLVVTPDATGRGHGAWLVWSGPTSIGVIGGTMKWMITCRPCDPEGLYVPIMWWLFDQSSVFNLECNGCQPTGSGWSWLDWLGWWVLEGLVRWLWCSRGIDQWWDLAWWIIMTIMS